MSEGFTKSGLSIPPIGLGTWDLQGPTCSRIVREALELGYRHIDGASMYENESEVGQGVIDSGVDREEIFITTKINTTSWTPASGSLVPSFAHGMALPSAVAGAVVDSATNFC